MSDPNPYDPPNNVNQLIQQQEANPSELAVPRWIAMSASLGVVSTILITSGQQDPVFAGFVVLGFALFFAFKAMVNWSK